MTDSIAALQAQFDLNKFRAPPLPTEAEISRTWAPGAPPLVSIICTTFNSAEFIQDALFGFLRQRTDFPFEIIVHDDASTDATPALLRSYEERYPNLVRPILQTVNQYSQGKKPFVMASAPARGRYLAFCDGDDFWTDPNKLALQIGFLERNPQFSISFHDAFYLSAAGEVLRDSKVPLAWRRDRTKEELQVNEGVVPTSSWVFRRSAFDVPPEAYKVLNADTFYLSLFGLHGSGKYHSEIQPLAYRVHSGGVWSRLSADEKRVHQINTSLWLHQYHQRVGNQWAADQFAARVASASLGWSKLRPLVREVLVRISGMRWAKRSLSGLAGQPATPRAAVSSPVSAAECSGETATPPSA